MVQLFGVRLTEEIDNYQMGLDFLLDNQTVILDFCRLTVICC